MYKYSIEVYLHLILKINFNPTFFKNYNKCSQNYIKKFLTNIFVECSFITFKFYWT